MAKGDDAVRKKRNKTTRKRMRNSESAVSARVGAIIAAKRRRKSGRRRICEGMCFSLPTPDDPFNDRHSKKDLSKREPKKRSSPNKSNRKSSRSAPDNAAKKKTMQPSNTDGNTDCCSAGPMASLNLCSKSSCGDEPGCPSKFLILCLNAIRDAWRAEDMFLESAEGLLATSSWGFEFWRSCSALFNVLDTSGPFASREQIAWVVSTASDTVARREKQGLFVSCPFLLFLVPSQEKAVEVRSICKPLKALGIHSVSLHPGASIDHQVCGLKSCEPEFIICTPERLLELVSLNAIDISGVSLLVLDGLKYFAELNIAGKINSIIDCISGDYHLVVFGDSCGKEATTFAQNLFCGPITRLSLHGTLACQSAFVLQQVHFCPLEEHKMPKVMEILDEAVCNQTTSGVKILLIAGSSSSAQSLASSLKHESGILSHDSPGDEFIFSKSEKGASILVKDRESISAVDVEHTEIVVLVDFPPSIEEYAEILTRMARHSVAGILHSFFCKADASLAQPLIEVLVQCGQTVPGFLSNLEFASD